MTLERHDTPLILNTKQTTSDYSLLVEPKSPFARYRLSSSASAKQRSSQPRPSQTFESSMIFI